MAALTCGLVLAGCGGGHSRAADPRPAAAATTTTTLLQVDNWTAPAVSGPASQTNFCTVLTAMYRHESELPDASPAVRKDILRDYVNTVPEALAAAPPDIAGAAGTYLHSVASILSSLVSAGLDYRKVKPGSLTPLLLDPQIKAAGNQVLAYSQSKCHYAIGGA
ncbi:MAG TPA: hypothetical protein VFN68_07880 [Acidimicrobiales bacterium]|nr:hypothetical protein [Acidimicrobiales bacterium]